MRFVFFIVCNQVIDSFKGQRFLGLYLPGRFTPGVCLVDFISEIVVRSTFDIFFIAELILVIAGTFTFRL